MIHQEPEKKQHSQTREHILQAAGCLVVTEGVAALTLDAVAKQAGVSKGGLLYHFPSKEVLMLAMIDAWHAWIKAQLDAERSKLPDPAAPGAWHHALINTSFHNCHGFEDISADMLAVVAKEPNFQTRLREGAAYWPDFRQSDGVPEVVSNLIHTSLDGLKLHKIVGLPMPEAQLEELRTLLHRLVDESVMKSHSESNHSRESA